LLLFYHSYVVTATLHFCIYLVPGLVRALSIALIYA
jgi:hypothetical protein